MKQLLLAVLFGLVLSTPMVTSQTSGFSQQGKVTHEMKDEGYTIAHSSLPLNSRARIANTSTGKEVEVTITRLIPASQNRIADVSSSVWQELGLSSDTDARIYTIVSARPQAVAVQAATPQVAAPQTTGSVAARPAQTGTSQAGTGSGSIGDLPSGVKFENNNNFIINGNPVGTPAPSVVASETRTPQQPAAPQQQAQPVVTYYEPQQAKPAVTYYEPQQVEPTVTYYEPDEYEDTYYEPQPPAVAYETRPAQPAVDIWTQIIKPAAETRTQSARPTVTYDTRPGGGRGTQPAVTYHEAPRPQQVQPTVTYYDTRPGQPVVRVETSTYQLPAPLASYETWAQQAQPFVTSDTRPGGGRTQPVVKIVNWPQTQNSQPVVYETQTQTQQAQPINETRTQAAQVKQAEKNLPEIRPNMINEIPAQASRTYVLIDASPDTPVPSVTIDNVPQTYRSVRQ